MATTAATTTILLCAALVSVWLTVVIARHIDAPASRPSVAQVSVREFSCDLVRRYRVPYVLDETMPDAAALLPTVFRGEFLCRRDGRLDESIPSVTHAAFTILHVPSASVRQTHADVRPSGPAATEDGGVRIVLRHGRVVIVPPNWIIVAGPDVDAVRLHDAASMLVAWARRVAL